MTTAEYNAGVAEVETALNWIAKDIRDKERKRTRRQRAAWTLVWAFVVIGFIALVVTEANR